MRLQTKYIYFMCSVLVGFLLYSIVFLALTVRKYEKYIDALPKSTPVCKTEALLL